MSRPDDEDFLSRWSARKLKARPEPETGPETAPEAVPAAPDAPPAEGAAEKSDAEILEELSLPDPDGLIKGDDFKAFLGAGIPARLRARALRRLWLSDPVLANLDGLNDYEQDFTDKATVRPDLKTAYRVGKGFLRQAAAADDPAPPRPADLPADLPAGGGPEAIAEGHADRGLDESPAAEGDSGVEPTDPPADEAAHEATAAASRPRRMQFRFDAG